MKILFGASTLALATVLSGCKSSECGNTGMECSEGQTCQTLIEGGELLCIDDSLSGTACDDDDDCEDDSYCTMGYCSEANNNAYVNREEADEATDEEIQADYDTLNGCLTIDDGEDDAGCMDLDSTGVATCVATSSFNLGLVAVTWVTYDCTDLIAAATDDGDVAESDTDPCSDANTARAAWYDNCIKCHPTFELETDTDVCDTYTYPAGAYTTD